MTTKLRLFLAPIVLGLACCLLSGCATPKGQLVVGTVGPQNPRGSTSGGFGQLQVFTQTVQNNDGGIPYPLHTAYWIYTTNGFKVKSVQNHVGPNDMSPMVVMIPAGLYHVIARADRYGIITVPTVIEGNRVTQIYLDSTGLPAMFAEDPTKLVHLPGGPAIGFRAGPPPPAAAATKK
jgi:hypothetical protein